MYSAGRNARLDEGESELFDNLDLVGISGRFCGILTERQLTFEDYSGYGIRINLSNISTLRNINLARLPNSFLTIGVVGVWVGVTVITPPLGWAIAATGALSAFGYLTLKTPVLSIETNAGDKYLVTGTQSELLRLCMMVDRVMHGSSIEEAKAGLRELEEEREKFLGETQPKALLAAPETMESSESAIFEAESVDSVFSPMAVTSPNQLISVAAEPQYAQPTVQEGGIFASLDALEPSPSNISQVSQTPPQPVDSRSAYERAWDRPESPEWYHEKDGLGIQEDRLDKAFSDATGSLDMFGEGGIFGVDSPTSNPTPTNYSESEPSMDFSLFDDKPVTPQQTTTGITSTTSYSPPTSPDPNRPLSSSQMIRSAQSRHLQTQPTGTPSWALPTPTESAVREECKPGLVKTAKAHSAWQRENKTRTLATPTTDPENFGEEFPAVSKLANSMTTGRVRSSVGRPKKQNWLASLISPIHPRRGYADVYGDEDGEAHNVEARFRSSQLLRLRSDQDHQADVATRAREMTSASGPSSARDALDNVVARVASGEDRTPTSNSENDQLRFSQLRPTSQKGDGRLPGIRQLK
ncbi:MAG: hypothetical protein VYA45_01870 [Candidatus Thermoplasmatota archaeon]|nr:hypothetical protein [Candidatus Thermoplasmatota archaeon]